MAKSNAVWGIDIGQCALKALKCRPHEKEPQRIVVESFDYIEYPKILTQPEADPAELVSDALEQFLSRNEVHTDRVAISVAGQSGLARFIKLPPVDSKKIPDIVRYEAKQQIPFSLEDVVWDYQQLTGGSEEDGFALEPEVGLFAMKRDQVARALQPLEDAGIEVDFIQLTPLAVYNYVCFDRMGDLDPQAYNPEEPPTSTVVISLGTDTTDLVVTNGYRVWQRNIPIGGNHFTRALSKELRLTFVKAEHLKRNATQADDPKAVFQAMRPVFSDLLAEIQRSLGYFMSIDKTAKIGDIIALGNAMKLPGLKRYLSQNMEQEVLPIESFDRLSEGSTTAGAQFKENVLSFAVAYGLCVQGLGKAEIHTNLLPEEIVRTRLVRAKKPWAVAGMAALFLAMTFNYYTHVAAWSDTVTEAMTDALTNADNAQQRASGYESQRSEIISRFTELEETGNNLVSNVEDRLLWMEMLKGLNAALPRDTRPAEARQETSEDISNREELFFTAMAVQPFEDLQSERFSIIEEAYNDSRGISVATGEGDEQLGAEDEGMGAEEESDYSESEEGEDEGGLASKGWVIQLTGYHYHNLDQHNQTRQFVNNTLVKNFEERTVPLPDGPNGEMIDVPLADLGLSHPWVVEGKKLYDKIIDPDAAMNDSRRGGGYGGGEVGEYDDYGSTQPTNGEKTEEEKSKLIKLRQYDFVVEFFWQPTTRSQRQQRAFERQERQEAAAADSAASETAAMEQDADLVARRPEAEE